MSSKTQAIRPAVILGLAVIFVVVWAGVWYGSGIFDGAVAPTPDSNGMVSTGAANASNILATLIEIVVVVISTIGSVALSLIFGAVKWLSGLVIDLINGDDPEPEEVPVAAPATATATATALPKTKQLNQPTLQNNREVRKEETAMQVMLLDAVTNGDADWTIALCHRINGTKYLRAAANKHKSKPKPKPNSPETDDELESKGESGGEQ